jgi:hypothetical protein
MYECDLLVVVRIATGDVTLIKNFQTSEGSRFYVDSLVEKIDSILLGDLRKIEGEWCRGCLAACALRKNSSSTSKPSSMAELNDLLINIPLTIRKMIPIVETALTVNSSNQIDHECSLAPQQEDSHYSEEPKPP